MLTRARNLSPNQISEYRRTAERREKTRLVKVRGRRSKAWRLAKKAAAILRDQYHAKRVVAFGSLLHKTAFNEWSDIDIAAWGIPEKLTFRAIGAVMDLDSDIEINLVDVNTCPPSLRKVIEKEGRDL